jgi:hypothetical protein
VSNARTVVLVLVLAGCRARQTGPDANYERGSRIYGQLYATELDEAYADPRMNEAAELLRKVDPHSVDADAAMRMLASIDSGRAALEKQRADREKMAAAAAASARPSPSIDPQQILAAANPDAGLADPFGPGAAIADLNAQSGGCLTEGEPFREQGTGATGTVYRLGKSEQCAAKLPGLVGQVVLVTDGHVYRRMGDPTEAKAPSPAQRPDAGAEARSAPPAEPRAAAARPDAAAARRPPLPTPSAEAQADGGETQMYVPGMPLPEGAAPADQGQR